jgi:uncharacterized membrane protein YccC
LLLALFLALTTFMTIYLTALGINFAIAGFFINLFVIIASGIQTNPAGQLERSFMILLGVGIAFVLCFLFPTRPLDNWQRALRIYLLCLSEFNETISNSYLDPQYALKKLKFEYRFHERRNRSIRTLNALRHVFNVIKKKPALLSPAALKQYGLTVESMEYLYNSLIALANIRHRLPESTEVASLRWDLSETHHLLAVCLKEIANKKSCHNVSTLADNIQHLQEKITTCTEELRESIIAFMHIATELPQELNTVCTLANTGETP